MVGGTVVLAVVVEATVGLGVAATVAAVSFTGFSVVVEVVVVAIFGVVGLAVVVVTGSFVTGTEEGLGGCVVVVGLLVAVLA